MSILEINDIDFSIISQMKFGETEPGTILRDVSTFISFIEEKNPPIGDKSFFLQKKELAFLNDLLSKPMKLDLSLPNQKSYSYIHGIYWLLKMIGMLRVKVKGKKSYMTICQNVKRDWEALNKTEQYWTLLDAWMFHGQFEVIGERGYMRDSLFHISSNLPIKRTLDPQEMQRLKSYMLALLELFGLISLNHEPPLPQKGWRVSSLALTKWGEFIFKLYFSIKEKEAWVPLQSFFSSHKKRKIIPKGAKEYSTFFKELKKYLPDYKKVFLLKPEEKREGIYRFICGKKSSNMIEISSQENLEVLASYLIKMFHLDNDHLYKFSYKDFWGIDRNIYHDYMEDSWPCVSEILVSDLFIDDGACVMFEHDFGSTSYIECKLEKVIPF